MIVARHSGRDAGQIGRTADLHGFAARRVRDMDVSHASSQALVIVQPDWVSP